jgi:hypothetical protein
MDRLGAVAGRLFCATGVLLVCAAAVEVPPALREIVLRDRTSRHRWKPGQAGWVLAARPAPVGPRRLSRRVPTMTTGLRADCTTRYSCWSASCSAKSYAARRLARRCGWSSTARSLGSPARRGRRISESSTIRGGSDSPYPALLDAALSFGARSKSGGTTARSVGH